MADLEIDANDFLKTIPKYVSDIRQRAVPMANRRAINRALIFARKLTIKRTQMHYKLTRQELVGSGKKGIKGFLNIRNARGNNLKQQEGSLDISGRPISMLRFLPPSKRKTQKQKGVSPKRRQKLRVEITPGQKKLHPKDFVQKGKGGQLLVFRRMTGKKKGDKEKLAAQKVPSIPLALKKHKSLDLITRMTNLRYQKNFQREFDFFVNKLSKKK